MEPSSSWPVPPTAPALEERLAGFSAEPIAPRPVLEEISVVIPTLGRAILETSLCHMARGSVWPARLIVVDQGIDTPAAGWIERLQAMGLTVTYVHSSQRGRSAGINRGLERVTTRFVAITDDDCLADVHWLETLLARLRQFPEAIITGRVDPAGSADAAFCVVPSLVPRVYDRPQLRAQPLIGGNMGAAMTIVHSVGLFDEDDYLHSAEDSDWGYRALRCGVSIRYEPDVIVQHYNWRSLEQRAQRYREYSRSQGGFYGKHLRSGDGLIWLQAARALLRAPARWLRGLLKHDQDMIDRGRADTLEMLPGILSGMRHARQLRASNCSGDIGASLRSK
jgi:GT2 family glycosyltransferase